MIHGVATVEIAAGRRDEFLAIFRRLVPKVLAEPGCLEYTPAVDLETGISAQTPVRGQVVTVIEKWEDLNALRAHLCAPHMADYRLEVKELVHRATLLVLEPAV